MNLAFPFHLDGRGGAALADDADHIRHLIEQLLFTNPGERVNRPDLGSGLLQLVFAPNSPELAAALQVLVEAALQQYLSDVVAVAALSVASQDAMLVVSIDYVVLRTGELQSATFVQRMAS